MKLETLAVHAGLAIDPASAAVAPPLHLSVTFEREPDGGYRGGHVYSRTSNPNRAALEQALAGLEAGAAAAAFASGQAATHAVFAALAPGDHVIVPTDVYFGTTQLLRQQFVPWGLEATFVDMADLAAVRNAVRPRTRLLWAETPSNPRLAVTDVHAVADIAHGAGAVCAVDNTWATPVLQRPLGLGADLVMHSTTKYLSGHSDVMGGAIVARAADGIFERIRRQQGTGGAVPSPFDCWLIRRGIRTLPYRMRGHSDNAERVAAFLAAHPRVERVHYPGLASHPGHAIAARQMARFGGMLSIEMHGGRDAAMAAAAKVRLFTRATSLGGVESLIEHRASVEAPDSGTPPSLLRLSIGLEHPDDLIEDLAQALA